MLRNRYNNDNKPLVRLNSEQLEMKDSIKKKIDKGIYRFEEVPCPICDKRNFNLLSLKDMYGLYFPVVICKLCGLIQTNPRMTQESYNLFYNNEYNKLDRPYYQNIYDNKFYQNIDNFFKAQFCRGEVIYNYLTKNNVLCKKDHELFILEVGCGAGGILQYFRKKGCIVKGIDLGEEYLTYGKKKYGLDLVSGTIFNVFLNRKPDIIIYSHVIEHLLKPNSELHKLKSIINKDGVLYIALPGIKNIKKGKTLLSILRNAHVSHFSLTTLVNLLQKNGWELITGDEGIKSLFKVSYNGNKDAKIINDYESATKYLRKIERFRWFIKFYHEKIKDPIKTILRKWLLFFGIYNFLKEVYKKLFS